MKELFLKLHCVCPNLSHQGARLTRLVSIFLVVCIVVFILPNKIFAWLQCIGSLVKIALFVLIIIVSLALIAGVGPTGKVHDGSYWQNGAFLNGFGVRFTSQC